jgi:UDP:flavonoid glycosyltransferase YjiC (YdhE family)
MPTSAAPVIVAATPLTGHTRPMLSLARGLIAAERRVTVVAASRFADDARATGADFVPLTGLADYDDRRLAHDHPQRAQLPPGPAQLDYDQRHLFGDTIPDQNTVLQILLKAEPAAVVLHDATFLGDFPQLLGAPGIRPRRSVGVGVNPVALPGRELTAFGPPPPIEGMDVRGVAAKLNAEMDTAFEPATDYLNRVLSGLGALRRIPLMLRAMYEVPDAIAQLTVPSFEFARIDAPSWLHLVGPLPAEPAAGWTPPEWWPELDRRRVIVVSQGTMANGDLTELIQPTLDGLADQDVLVIAALGRSPRPGELRVPGNARLVDYVPFDQLLPKVDALVTNGGYGATQQAIGYGIPVVVAGTTEDKPMVAARVAAFGVGLDLGTQHPTPTAVAAAVTRLLAEPVFRERTEIMAAEHSAADPIRAIVELLDQA